MPPTFDFSTALQKLLEGSAVARASWSRGQFLIFVPGYSAEPPPEHLRSLCTHLNGHRRFTTRHRIDLCIMESPTVVEGEDSPDATTEVSCGWTPTSLDLFAEDWLVVDRGFLP